MSPRIPIAAALMTAFLAAGAGPSAAEERRSRAVASSDLYVFFMLNGGALGVGFSGRTYPVGAATFRVGAQLLSNGPDPASGSIRITMPPGIRWASGPPTAAEGCEVTDAVTCTTPEPIAPPPPAFTGFQWVWPVVADAPGSYPFRLEIASSSAADPDTTNNAITIVVSVQPATGGDDSAAVSASAVRVSPAKPRAGSTVVASVRVSRSGAAVRPTRVTCAASVGTTKVKGGAKSSSGLASCLFRTPRAGKGKTMRGSVSFRAGGRSFTKRFSARLR
jgi:hypothetical protein